MNAFSEHEWNLRNGFWMENNSIVRIYPPLYCTFTWCKCWINLIVPFLCTIIRFEQIEKAHYLLNLKRCLFSATERHLCLDTRSGRKPTRPLDMLNVTSADKKFLTPLVRTVKLRFVMNLFLIPFYFPGFFKRHPLSTPSSLRRGFTNIQVTYTFRLRSSILG